MVLTPRPGRANWDDQSDYVVHFTNDSGSISAANHFVAIIREGRLEARNRFGAGRSFPHCRPSVCFTEAPLHQLRRIAERRSQFGLGFYKRLIIHRGGGPVFYAYGDHCEALIQIMHAHATEPSHPIWKVASFIEQPRFNYSFEWEREWRVPGDLEVTPAIIRFLTGPEEEHAAMRAYFEEQHQAGILPNLAHVKLLDLEWDRDRLQSTLEGRGGTSG